MVKRDAELKLRKISQHNEEKWQQLNNKSLITQPVQQKRQLKVLDEKKVTNIEKVLDKNTILNSITIEFNVPVLFNIRSICLKILWSSEVYIVINIDYFVLIKSHRLCSDSKTLLSEKTTPSFMCYPQSRNYPTPSCLMMKWRETNVTDIVHHGELCMLQMKICPQKHDSMTQATTVHVPKPPPYTSLLNIKRRQKQQQLREQQAQVKVLYNNDVIIY